MSRKIEIDSIDYKDREKIVNQLQIKLEGPKFSFMKSPKYIYPINIEGDHAFIPFSYGKNCPGGPFKTPDRKKYSKLICKFNGTLRENQKEIKKECLTHLNKYGSSIIAAYPGFGKTCTSIYIATKIKLRTLILVNRIVLIDQWVKSIDKFCPSAKVQVLKSKSKMEDCDFYIMNAANVPKNNSEYYKNIGFLIVDEVHLIMAEGLSKCMQKIVPRYLLGLSATPYREDGLNILLDLYFGKKKIFRKLYREHIVYKVETSFEPTVEFSSNGKVNWGVLLESQANDKDRNEMIINIIKHFKDRVFLVLCKRVSQGRYLVKRLQEEEVDVTSLIGSQQEYEQKSRVLVGTSSKAGTGFDHPRLNAMILATDIQSYFIQYLGRCMRTEDVKPIIFDIVDKNPILNRHFTVRRNVYTDHGGSVYDFSKLHPEVNVV